MAIHDKIQTYIITKHEIKCKRESDMREATLVTGAPTLHFCSLILHPSLTTSTRWIIYGNYTILMN